MSKPLVALFVFFSLALRPLQAAVTYDVNSTEDHPDDLINGVCADAFGKCTLRAAVMEADLGPNPGGAQMAINLPAGTYTLTRPVSIPDDASNGDLDVGVSLRVFGAGVGVTVIDANHVDRAFAVRGASADLWLYGLTIRNGRAAELGGRQTWGGAILTFRPLLIEHCAIEASATFLAALDTGEDGGAILAQGPSASSLIDLTIRDSTFRNNYSRKAGGAVEGTNCATFIAGSTFDHNTAYSDGGALRLSGGTLLMENSTLDGNEAGRNGGGAYLGVSDARMNNVTIAGNGSDSDLDGEGVGGGFFASTAVYVENSILRNVNDLTHELDDCTGAIYSNGHNLIGSAANCLVSGAYSTADPSFIPVFTASKDNGGPTTTYMPGPGSPAIGAGDPTGCDDADGQFLTTDQRGVKRWIGAACDLGAVEVEPVGDANGDGFVNVSDVFYLINALFAGGPQARGRGNVNGDAFLNVADVFYLVNYLFAGGPAPV